MRVAIDWALDKMRKPIEHHSLLFNIIQQKTWQVNHQYDAQSEKQKRGAL